MSDIPAGLVLKRHRDLVGLPRHGIHVRRALLGLFALVPILGLLNVFGQKPVTQTASSPAANLKVYAPNDLRGGLLWSARFHIYANRDLKKATLVLDPGWAESMSINTIEPSPLGQGSRNGRLVLDLGHIPRGRSFVLFMQFQANATNIGWRRPANVELDDGNKKLLVVHHSLTIFP